ncbi:MAG: AbrB/MazE/SpoVT family DNA-binding domain-containing protein [Trueperaceae bacterium]|jgi:AbrB family looped-hinge helix DNA binding protein|nr:MAG: AbrB/MazE/SpoVT family DNA-binding domain-containing protein [Trueperaceae bacterium]
MKKTATVTSKGQVTIPQEIRWRLGIEQGDQVVFAVEDGLITLRPYRGEENPFEKYAGALGSFATTDEIDAWLANLRDE